MHVYSHAGRLVTTASYRSDARDTMKATLTTLYFSSWQDDLMNYEYVSRTITSMPDNNDSN